MRIRLAAAAALSTLAVAGTAGAAGFPTTFELPVGYQPEGIASGKGHQLYVGSIPTGDVRLYDARTGEGRLVVDAPTGRAAIGLKADNKRRLFVAGGPTGDGYVYDARTGATLRAYDFTSSASTFVNDVTLTKSAAYFTDSRNPVLYVVDTRAKGKGKGKGGQALPTTFRTLNLTGIPYESQFNLNGIAATANGKTLFAIHSGLGRLYRIDPRTGAGTQVDTGSIELTNGDGLLLVGKRLYVVRNRDNEVVVLRLSGDNASATLEKTITSEAFRVPTTVARIGSRLYLPNARFGIQSPGTADFDVVQVKR